MKQWTIDWVKSEHDASIIAEFFTSNIINDENYISCESIKAGLSRDFKGWSEGFATRVKLEFIESVSENSNNKLISCWSLVGLPLGFASISLHKYRDRQQCILQDLFVIKEQRRNKIGTNLLTFIHDFLDQKGIHQIFLDLNIQNKTAMNFLEKSGYKHRSNTYVRQLDIN